VAVLQMNYHYDPLLLLASLLAKTKDRVTKCETTN
jgi:hypothetical protein